MKVVGLTGGIGSGKSTVSKFLADLGAIIIDADRVGHQAFEPDTEAYRQVVAAFGPRILTPVGEIDRHKLGSIVFADPKARDRLNRIMHPRIQKIVKDRMSILIMEFLQVAKETIEAKKRSLETFN